MVITGAGAAAGDSVVVAVAGGGDCTATLGEGFCSPQPLLSAIKAIKPTTLQVAVYGSKGLVGVGFTANTDG